MFQQRPLSVGKRSFLINAIPGECKSFNAGHESTWVGAVSSLREPKFSAIAAAEQLDRYETRQTVASRVHVVAVRNVCCAHSAKV